MRGALPLAHAHARTRLHAARAGRRARGCIARRTATGLDRVARRSRPAEATAPRAKFESRRVVSRQFILGELPPPTASRRHSLIPRCSHRHEGHCRWIELAMQRSWENRGGRRGRFRAWARGHRCVSPRRGPRGWCRSRLRRFSGRVGACTKMTAVKFGSNP